MDVDFNVESFGLNSIGFGGSEGVSEEFLPLLAIGAAGGLMGGLFGNTQKVRVKETLNFMSKTISKTITSNIVKNSSNVTLLNKLKVTGNNNVVTNVQQTITAKINWDSVIDEKNIMSMRSNAKANFVTDVTNDLAEAKKNSTQVLPSVNGAIDSVTNMVSSVLSKTAKDSSTDITKTIDNFIEDIISSETLTEIKTNMQLTNEIDIVGNANVVTGVVQVITIDAVFKVVQGKIFESAKDFLNEVDSTTKAKNKLTTTVAPDGTDYMSYIIIIIIIMAILGGGYYYTQQGGGGGGYEDYPPEEPYGQYQQGPPQYQEQPLQPRYM